MNRRPGRPPTNRSMDVMAFMLGYHQKNDQLPPARVIAQHFGWASTNAAYTHLRTLAKAGFIEKNDAGKYRFSRSKK